MVWYGAAVAPRRQVLENVIAMNSENREAQESNKLLSDADNPEHRHEEHGNGDHWCSTVLVRLMFLSSIPLWCCLLEQPAQQRTDYFTNPLQRQHQG
jgi:hypothetical protein